MCSIDKMELARKLTDFGNCYDPYGFMDEEDYHGCVYEHILSSLNSSKQEVIGIVNYLEGIVLEENEG